MALTVTVWSSVLLLILTGGVLRVSADYQALARHTIRSAQAEALADGAVALGYAIAQQSPDGVLPLVPIRVRHETVSLEIRFEDEGGKIDLNAAPRPLLQALFQAAGLSSPAAARLVERLANHRRNVPFTNVEEAKALFPDMASVWPSLHRILTVYTHAPFVDAAVADDTVLSALFGSPERVQIYKKRRARNGRFTAAGVKHASRLLGTGFTIVGSAIQQNGHRARREALFVRSGHALNRHRLVHWKTR